MLPSPRAEAESEPSCNLPSSRFRIDSRSAIDSFCFTHILFRVEPSPPCAQRWILACIQHYPHWFDRLLTSNFPRLRRSTLPPSFPVSSSLCCRALRPCTCNRRPSCYKTERLFLLDLCSLLPLLPTSVAALAAITLSSLLLLSLYTISPPLQTIPVPIPFL